MTRTYRQGTYRIVDVGRMRNVERYCRCSFGPHWHFLEAFATVYEAEAFIFAIDDSEVAS